ncbi:SDR family oxidoreductase [Xanthocytophaga agilis]|uniref:SDR family oxidoreductase n=1 Tax=Xanthocytophaga agilis TaxID=3048010 RepID=A0AAE3RCJ3_9BACT|nr:SDR family oxidoreductase [Xanthocytophaga agilis]MDJ1505915.1 SDR family oxidoreductase [Xanthocytophaga agilis]
MDLQLTNKTAFISGSTAGIGYAIAKRLATEGATVLINGRTQIAIDKAVNELKTTTGNPNISGIMADFLDVDQINQLLNQLPPIDILINNAGIFEPKSFVDITDQEWLRFFDMNVMSGIRLSRHLFPKMLEKNWGRIIFISSETAVSTASEMVHYSMTKTAQIAIGRGMAELTKGTGVTVNSILPGPTKSRGISGFISDMAAVNTITVQEAEQNFFKDIRPTSLLQRFASVEEIADTVAYYASPLASATNGAAIRVEGGTINTII